MDVRRRVGMPLSYFHVMNRGARRMGIFSDDEDCERFVGLLGRFAVKYGVTVLSWCLVINHYHLEIHATGDQLWKMIRDLERTYCRYFNEKTGLSGCLFQGPFKSVLLPDMEAVSYVSRYIHANSRDMRTAPAEYPWSSCRSYLGLAPVPRWLDVRPVTKWVGGSTDAYRAYLDQAPPKRRRRSEFDQAHESFIGHLEDRCRRSLAAGGDLYGNLEVSTLVCWKAHKVFGIPLRALATHYGYSSNRSVSTMICRLEKRLAGSPDLREHLSNC